MKILLIDIETMPLLSYMWQLFDEQSGLPMLKSDWAIISWSAKWLGSKEIIYRDQRNARNIEDDKSILKDLWNLIDEADVIVGHNGKKFDLKKINARFLVHGMQPPSPYRVLDTLTIAKKNFAMTSNKLEYLCKKLNCKKKKLTARKFPGFDLWRECLAGNKEAWVEMEKYNKQDVLALEELYHKLIPWDSSINFSVFNQGKHICSCGSKELTKKGFSYSNNSVFQRFKCKKCGKPFKSKVNELDTEQRKNMKVGVNR